MNNTSSSTKSSTHLTTSGICLPLKPAEPQTAFAFFRYKINSRLKRDGTNTSLQHIKSSHTSFPTLGGDYMLTDLQREGVCASDIVTIEWTLERLSYDLEKRFRQVFVTCFISQWMKRSKHGLFVFPPRNP